MCKKASRQINEPKGISKFLTQDSRKSIYRSFIAANFNYCPISWIFCGKKNTSKLEKLQERALRLVFCDQTATYDDLLKRGNFLSLKAFRTRCLAVEVYKCVHGLNPTYINDLFTEPFANYNLSYLILSYLILSYLISSDPTRPHPIPPPPQTTPRLVLSYLILYNLI